MSEDEKNSTLTNDDLAKNFLDRYNELVKEMGFKIIVRPNWVLRDDGTFSMQLVSTIEKVNP